ncbi:TIGR02281 family clan AA aspartic protease [Pseudomonas sp. URMO17WK12:I4]|uniref:TIGR02281 family clan AA aspartic protease n=1 Tax=Pseudomonas sp. URMO17WK12:I4 TaxID=1283292 RepID=UPI0004857BB1
MRRLIMLMAGLLVTPLLLAATSVQVVGLFPGAAVLSVDGQRKLVRVGQTGPAGVQVVSVDSRSAVLRVDGVERSYSLSREYNTAGVAAPQKQTLSIARSNGGHYWAEGAINGRAQQFLVDTGATSVALNENHARRLGIDYRTRGQPIQVNTASGTAKGWRVTLDKVSVGSLQVLGVEAVVLEGASPSEALLGMSFLNRVGWRVENNLLVLESRL